ncbi:Nif3-like dinuclear metal center hexameric protein [Paenibacillus sp. BC26]|uniref:Nif3-like dinuclear metal center hexameric protein n=1 Tax=Paenibacillus sp. BC26 TaxID=1881032 RepID=UPI0008ECF89D|nr:Nif3-like dinuclear metal center hexameric protein [Paenibacillus sp. BC26]SFS73727.1 Putative GTP cyclohydrolase 1 type 2, NIF3 family [Paenibacillus sp. BC26]
MIASDILSFWQINRLSLYSDEGFRFGPDNITVTGIMVCWMPSVEAIHAARDAGCNLIITHEELNFPPVYSGASLEDDLCGATFLRMKALAESGITLFRAHGTLDHLCILDAFGDKLGFTNPTISAHEYSYRYYDFELKSFDAVCQQVKTNISLPYLRVYGDPNKQVKRAGLIWGGVGISANPHTVQQMIKMGCDVLIGGEAEELPILAAKDAGVCYIETSHAYSENPGLLIVSQQLKRHFPVPIHFYENKRPWALRTRNNSIDRGALA